MHRTFVLAAVLLVVACNGNTVQSPTSQVKQCLFDTECMSSQRCSREKDNVMGVCVDKVATQPTDGTAPTTTSAAPPGGTAAPGSPPPLPPPPPTVQPQPGDISL